MSEINQLKNTIVNEIVEDKNNREKYKISKVNSTYMQFVESVFEKVIDNVDSL